MQDGQVGKLKRQDNWTTGMRRSEVEPFRKKALGEPLQDWSKFNPEKRSMAKVYTSKLWTVRTVSQLDVKHSISKDQFATDETEL